MPEDLKDFIRHRIRRDLAAGRHDAVVTRFPPEPNGALTIGHAKSICLNFGVAQEFGGRTYISSAGLRAILVTAKTLRKRDAKFALCSLQSSIKEVMEISGFDQVIAIHPSKEEALSAFGASA